MKKYEVIPACLREKAAQIQCEHPTAMPQCVDIRWCADQVDALLAQRDALVDALERVSIHLAAVGYPVNAQGEYHKHGEWNFTDALPRPADAREIKSAYLLSQEALASVKGGEA